MNPLLELCVAMVLFVASHVVPSMPAVRPRLVGVLTEKGFLAAYSIVSIALIVWVVHAYNIAPYVALWDPGTGLRHLSLGVMPLAFILVIGGLTSPNPSAVMQDGERIAAAGPAGMLRITRHPVMWGIALWGVLHLLARGDAASLVFFGGFTVLALGGAWAQDLKKRAQLGAGWQTYEAVTSFVPFAALIGGRTRLRFAEIGWWRIAAGLVGYAVVLALHPLIFGVDPWPL